MRRRLLGLLAILALPLTLRFVGRGSGRPWCPSPGAWCWGSTPGVPDYDYRRGTGPDRRHRGHLREPAGHLPHGHGAQQRDPPASHQQPHGGRPAPHLPAGPGARPAHHVLPHHQHAGRGGQRQVVAGQHRARRLGPLVAELHGLQRAPGRASPRRKAWSGTAWAPRWPAPTASRTAGAPWRPRCARSSRASSPTASTSTATTASPSATAWTSSA